MGVRITDLETVSLYDSVTGWAFGPTFPSHEAATDFLSYTAGEVDPRLWDTAKTDMLYQAWVAARGEAFGLTIGHPA